MNLFMAAQPDLDLSSELRTIAAFAELSKEALVEITSAAQQRRVHAMTTLVEQGVASTSMVLLLRGAGKITRTAPRAGDAGEAIVVLDVMRAPCIVTDVSVLDGQPAASTAITLRSSHLATIDRRVVHRVAASHPSFARALLARAAQELRAHTRRIDEIVGGPVDERIKHLLDSLAEQHGTPLGQGRFIAIPLRRRDLACMVNATTETVSRLLAKFEREGHARSTRDGIWWRATPRSDRPESAQHPPSASIPVRAPGEPPASARGGQHG